MSQNLKHRQPSCYTWVLLVSIPLQYLHHRDKETRIHHPQPRQEEERMSRERAKKRNKEII